MPQPTSTPYATTHQHSLCHNPPALHMPQLTNSSICHNPPAVLITFKQLPQTPIKDKLQKKFSLTFFTLKTLYTTVSQPTTTISRTFLPSNHISQTLKQPPNNPRTPPKQPPNNPQTTPKQPPNNPQTTHKQPSNNPQTTPQTPPKQPPNNPQTTLKQLKNNPQKTPKQPTNILQHSIHNIRARKAAEGRELRHMMW